MNPQAAEKSLVACAPGSCDAMARREEEVDAIASSTTSNTASARNSQVPEGLRRREVVCRVVAPRR
jgi:hypothetical protein